MLGLQIVGILFGLTIVYFTFLYYKRKEFTVSEMLLWVVFSLAFIIISLFPSVLDPVVETFNIARTLDLLIIAGFMFLIFVAFHSYATVRKTQEKVERIVRELALSERLTKGKDRKN